MSREYQDCLKDALELDLDDRAVLAVELKSTLHDGIDPEIEEAWVSEVEQRTK